ncbi:hypothetical protein BYT27DRAFT_7219077 [Phlegmacium glaucopus]|nr:hypothetical protein BYT27DRAFT_7219077 [Phlegmacium glaucopus]
MEVTYDALGGNDLWLFHTQEYKWNQVEFREMDAKPSITLPSTADPSPAPKPVGALLKTTSKAPNKQSQTQLTIKWERRKRASDAYAASLRSGCVTDEDTNEETLESVFWNDLYRYQLTGKGKWSSMTLKKPKAKGGAKSKGVKKKQKDKDAKWKEQNSEEEDEGEDEIWRNLSREYTLDDFYALQLDKMDKYICLKESDVVIPDGDVECSSGDDDNDDDDDDDDEEEEERDGDDADVEHDEPDEEEDELRSRPTAFMGVSKDDTCSPEDIQSTPLPGETLAMFYARSREYWTQKAHGNSDNQGKQLRRDGFTLAEERYNAYKPILAEVEKILEEAGLDEEGMRRGAAGGGGSPLSAGGVVGFSLNRR